MVRSFSLALSGTAKRLTDVYGDGTSVVNEAHNIPYRQLLLTVTGAGATIGDTSASAATGIPLAVGAAPYGLGPFDTGPLRLSDLWAVGAGATIQVIGVPF